MKKKDVTETGLIRTDEPVGAAMGTALLEEAQKRNRENVQTQAIAHVQSIQVQLKKQRDYLESCERNIALLEAKLRAIAKGEITLSTYGDMIQFTDKALGKAIVSMKECINCGAPR